MNVLITGGASGIGKATRDCFLKAGHNVYAIDLCEIEKQENLVSFKGDITNFDDMVSIKNKLIQNNVKFDVIINVAGIHKMASLVESDYSSMKKVIDINLSGTMLVNRIFHSELIEKGKVIIITSEVASFDPMPFNGLYNISKTALDCYAQALRQELNLLNQKVITIRPGSVETPLSNNSLDDTERLVNSTIIYKKQSIKFMNLVKKFMGKPMSSNIMGKFIYKVANKKHPKLIYKKHQNIGLILLNILPKRLQCFIIKKLLG